MQRVPFFIEVLHSPQSAPLQVCRKMMAALFKARIAPLPFAGSLNEVRDVLAALKTKGMAPSIFVINTYWAEEVLAQLDPFLGQTPVLFLTREIAADGATVRMLVGENPERISGILRTMTPRKNSLWTYGTKHADAVSLKAANAIIEFLQDGNFVHIERHAPAQPSYMQAMNLPGMGQSAAMPAIRATPPPSTTIQNEIRTPPPEAKRNGVQGSLQQLSLPAVLIMLELEKKSGELLVTHDRDFVKMLLCKGRVVSARAGLVASRPIVPDGAEAIYPALLWSTGDFDFTPCEVNVRDEVNAQTTQLLMEGARRKDEPANAAS